MSNLDTGNAIDVRNLTWAYKDNKVFDGLYLKIKKNLFYSIIGSNGSGKTTLIRNIARSLIPGTGKVFINGKDIMSMKFRELARNLAVVPQNTYIDYDFSVMDIVMMGRTPHIKRFNSESAYDLDVVRISMERANVWRLKDKNISQISGGEYQRVILARALAQETDILLLDEPISQLDIQHQVELMELIATLVRDSEKTAVAVLHDLNIAASYCDMIILIDKGKIISIGSPAEVLTKEILESVYNVNISIITNPVNGKPHVIPTGAYC